MTLENICPGLWKGSLTPRVGEIGAAWRGFGAQVVVGHPTFKNDRTIGKLLSEGIRSAAGSFGGRKTAFVVTDGTCTQQSHDLTTINEALEAAKQAIQSLSREDQSLVHVVVTPYEGYGGDFTAGKGSALKLIFDEMGACDATMLVLLDGDLRNDMPTWHNVFAGIEAAHESAHPGQPMFITARYARHFVDASLTRFVVGPLTTLLGTYVPGGISGDIVLNAAAVAKEREATWTASRRRYGTDISTTFDNIADPEAVIYEAYLGAKLHDIPDEAKLSVMPAQVIGAALERLLFWDGKDGRVQRILTTDQRLRRVVPFGPEKTHIGFVDPGHTDVFDIDAKRRGLADRFEEFEPHIRLVCGDRIAEKARAKATVLAAKANADDDVSFLDIDQGAWIDIVYRAVAFVLSRRDLDPAMRCLNYLYTGAFLELVKDCLATAGWTTVGQVRAAQRNLGIPQNQAESFYRNHVDAVAQSLAFEFFEGRSAIASYIQRLGQP